MKSAHTTTHNHSRRTQYLAVLVLLVASLSLLSSGLTGCATVSKGMESLKSIMKIYDAYEKPVSDLAIISGINSNEEEEE